MLLYYITDRMQLGADEGLRRTVLLRKIGEAAQAGVDYIQLRERDLTTKELEQLSAEAVATVRAANSRTKLLINSRVDVALASGADGVHLRSNDIAASEARAIWAKSTHRTDGIIAQSCHSLAEVLNAEAHGADFVVFGPVFGKENSTRPATGVNTITRIISRSCVADPKVEAGQSLRMPVIALGGLTSDNARSCLQAGAAGVAGIRLFQQDDIAEVARRFRSAVT